MNKYRSTNEYLPQRSTSNRWANQVIRLHHQQHNSRRSIPNDQAQLSNPSSLVPDSTISPPSLDKHLKNNGKCINIVLIAVGISLVLIAVTATIISIYLIVLINKPTTTTTSTTAVWTVCGNDDTVIKFDNLPVSTAVPNGYRDILWTNAYTYTATTNTTGYYTGIVSPPNIIYNGGANPMTMQTATGRFYNLFSAAAAAAWNDNLLLTVIGNRSNVIVASQTFTLQVFTVSYLTFSGFTGIDTVRFTTSGGTQNAVANGSGTHFAMDNICLTFS